MMGIMIYDAHVHFDMRRGKSYQILRDELQNNFISKCLLVLNSIEEENLFLRYEQEIVKDGYVAAIAAIFDIKKIETLKFYNRMKSEGINTVIKIHPRMTKIKREDFSEIKKTMCCIGAKNILIDDFIYGPELDSHIGTELAVYLAKGLPDIQIVLAHAGGCDMLKTLLITRPLKNIFYDYSLTCNYLENTSVRQDLINGLMFTNNRIMFGTDYPDFNFEASKRVMYDLCSEAGINQEQIQNVFYRNALKIYGGELNNA